MRNMSFINVIYKGEREPYTIKRYNSSHFPANDVFMACRLFENDKAVSGIELETLDFRSDPKKIFIEL